MGVAHPRAQRLERRRFGSTPSTPRISVSPMKRAVRNNEAYVSQYLDLLPVAHPALGWIILARQNQPMSGGLHPWLASGLHTWRRGLLHGWVAVLRRRSPSERRASGPCVDRRCRPGDCSTSSPWQGCRAGWSISGRGPSRRSAFVGRYLDDHPAASTARTTRSG